MSSEAISFLYSLNTSPPNDRIYAATDRIKQTHYNPDELIQRFEKKNVTILSYLFHACLVYLYFLCYFILRSI